MTTNKSNKFWLLITILLVAIIAAGSVIACSRYGQSQPIEISISPSQELRGEIYIGGAVCNPGVYPLKAGDSLEALVQSAGGTTSGADSSNLKLYIPRAGEEIQPQRININRAEAWLLEALPGIGETRAQAIIDYRNQNGAFHNINELLKVKGIGVATYEQIKHLITVAD